MRRFLILDPGLNDYGSHHPNVVREISTAATKSGYAVSIYGHKRISVKLKKDLGVIPHFSVHTYSPILPLGFKRGPQWKARRELVRIESRFSSWRVILRGFDFERKVQITEREIRKINFRPDDIVFVHSGQAVLFEAMLRLLAKDAGEPRPRIHFEFGVNSGAHAIAGGAINGFSMPDPKQDVRPYLYAMSRKAHETDDTSGIVFGAFTADVSQSFGKFLNLKVRAFPLPSTSPPNSRSREGLSRPVIGILGYQSHTKGYQFVSEIVAQVQSQRPNCEFLIHNSNLNLPAHKEVCALAKSASRVTLVEGPADPDMWWSLIERCDLIVCPYQASRYQGAYSAIMGEAILGCVPVVGPANTSLETMAKTYGSGFVAFSIWNAEEIAVAIIDAIDNLDLLAKQSVLASENWQKTNGAKLLVERLAAGF